jgi:hypothetical protein
VPPGSSRVRAQPQLVVAALLLLNLTRCASCGVDVDGQPGGAQWLHLQVPRTDSLDCSSRVRDCADWYRLQLADSGNLQISVEPIPGPGIPASFEVGLARSAGENPQFVGRATSSGHSQARIRHRTSPGTYFVVVSAASGRVGYSIRADLRRPAPRPPPKQPEPSFETVPGGVIELEGRSNEDRRVLIDLGEKQGMQRGLSGRLVQNGREIGEIEITEVYKDGSRARILGPLAGTVTPATRVEVYVPRGRTPPPEESSRPPGGSGTWPPPEESSRPPGGSGTWPPPEESSRPPGGSGTWQPPEESSQPPGGSGTWQPPGESSRPPGGSGTWQPPGEGGRPPSKPGDWQPPGER